MGSRHDHERGEFLDAERARERLAEGLGEPTDARELAALLSLAAAEEASDDHPDALLVELRRRLEREQGLAGSLRSLPTWGRLLVGFGAIAAAAVAVLALQPRPDLDAYPRVRMGLAVCLLGGLAAASVVFALRPLHKPALPRDPSLALLLGGLLATFGLAALPAAHTIQQGRGIDSGEFLDRAMDCFGYGALAALPIFVLLRLLDRGGHHSLARALLAAGAGGLSANLLLQLHCSGTSPGHLLLGHASVAAAVIVAVLAIRRGR